MLKTFIKPLSGEDNRQVLKTLDDHVDLYGSNAREDLIHGHFYGVYDEYDYLIAFFAICTWHYCGEAVLACVWVEPKYRKQGIFKKIVKFFKDKCFNYPLLTIGAMATNEVAVSIYRKMFREELFDERDNSYWYIVRVSRRSKNAV